MPTLPDKIAEADPPYPSFIILIARLLMASMFIESCFDKLVHWAAYVTETASKGIPFPALALMAATGIEAFGSFTLISGRGLKPGACVLAGYVCILGFFYFDFWNLSGGAATMARKEFLKDLGVIAGLILIAYLPKVSFIPQKRDTL
jgi:putative oxidoreductase